MAGRAARHYSGRMNLDQLEGTAKIVKGKLQQAVGELIHDDELYVRGSRQQVRGQRLKRLGTIRERIEDYRRRAHG